MDADTRARIQAAIESQDVVLFMKGTPAAPRCGFSAQVVEILDTLGVTYGSIDVLADPSVRDGIKEYSDWPTIPQLYVRRDFVGGCDIVKEMFASGELAGALGVKLPEVAVPAVTVTPRAAEALAGALASDDEVVRLSIGPRFQYDLAVGARQPGDVLVEAAGVTIALDRASARRAGGTGIDLVDGPGGSAFKITNPSEPPRVRPLGVQDLARRLREEGLRLFDVRTPAERQIATLPGAVPLDRAAQDAILALPRATPLAFLCHHGSRSERAAEHFLEQGFTEVYNVAGGIDAWSQQIDPAVPRY